MNTESLRLSSISTEGLSAMQKEYRKHATEQNEHIKTDSYVECRMSAENKRLSSEHRMAESDVERVQKARLSPSLLGVSSGTRATC